MTQPIVKTKKMIERLAELTALGLSDADIAESLNKEFSKDLTGQSVKNMIKRQSIITNKMITTDEDIKEFYRDNVFALINKVKDNLNILEDTRKVLIEKLEILKKEELIPEAKLVMFIREISNSIKTQNDSIRTMNETLKRFEVEKQETKISTIESIQETVKILKNLEDMGFIEIKPDYYKSDIYKESIKRVKKDSEED